MTEIVQVNIGDETVDFEVGREFLKKSKVFKEQLADELEGALFIPTPFLSTEEANIFFRLLTCEIDNRGKLTKCNVTIEEIADLPGPELDDLLEKVYMLDVDFLLPSYNKTKRTYHSTPLIDAILTVEAAREIDVVHLPSIVIGLMAKYAGDENIIEKIDQYFAKSVKKIDSNFDWYNPTLLEFGLQTYPNLDLSRPADMRKLQNLVRKIEWINYLPESFQEILASDQWYFYPDQPWIYKRFSDVPNPPNTPIIPGYLNDDGKVVVEHRVWNAFYQNTKDEFFEVFPTTRNVNMEDGFYQIFPTTKNINMKSADQTLKAGFIKEYKQNLKNPTDESLIKDYQTAAANGYTDIVAYLMKLLPKETDLNAPRGNDDAAGTTVLMDAVAAGQIDTVQFLVANRRKNPDVADGGIDINAVTAKGVSPVYIAASAGRDQILDTLLQAGANPDTANTEGFTPLMMATLGGRLDSLILLLENGADITAFNNKGKTAIDMAIRDGRTNFVEILAGYLVKIDDQDVELVSPADVAETAKHVDDKGNTLLMTATMEGRQPILDVVLNMDGTNINATNHDGKTALDLAKEQRRQPVVDQLIIASRKK